MSLFKPDGAGLMWGRASSEGNQGSEKHLNTGAREPGPAARPCITFPLSAPPVSVPYPAWLFAFFVPYTSLLCPFFLLLMTIKSKCDRLAFGSMFTISKFLQVEEEDEEKQGCHWLRCSHAGFFGAGCHPSSGALVFLATTTKTL